MLEGRTPGPLPEPALKSLRQVFHGRESPVDVQLELFGDLALLPDRPSQARFQELHNAEQTWLTSGASVPARALSLEDSPTPIEPCVLLRGNPNNLGEAAPRRSLTVLAGVDSKSFGVGSGRLDLARAIASPDNPLTARALVNRVWMCHLGTPLVATPGDFGLRSEPPIHPELLDYLAAWFVGNGWSIKALHRLIMRSSTYQQRGDDRPMPRELNTENTLYWRINGRRLDFEPTRDASLAVSGRLDGKIGGLPMLSLMDDGVDGRTLYGSIDRLNLPGLYRAFDFPDPPQPARDATRRRSGPRHSS